MHKLSGGTLQQIINGENVKKPVFQLLNYKRLPNLISDWYMLNVSDGSKMNEYTLLSTELNNLFENGTLTKYTIFKVTDYKMESTNDDKKTLIITGCEVVFPGNQLRRIIGNPTIIEFEPETYKPHSFTAIRPEDWIKTSCSPVEKNFMQPSTSKSTNTFFHEEHLLLPTIPIKELNSDNHRTIIARVFHKFPITECEHNKADNIEKQFLMYLITNTTEFQCVAFNYACDMFYKKIENGKVYSISNYKLQDANPQYKTLNNEYEIVINENTQINECHDDASIPLMCFDFCPINQVENKQERDKIDVLGVIVQSSSVIQKRKQLVRNVDIVDNSRQGGAKVCITLWDQQAEEFDCPDGTILAIKGARVDKYYGKILTVTSLSVIKKNPNLQEALELRIWYDGNNYVDNGIHFNTPMLTFKQAKKELELYSSLTYKLGAKVDSIISENSIYKGCPEKGCGKKLDKLPFDKYKCNKCIQIYSYFKPCLRLTINISDATGGRKVTAFNEVAANLVDLPLQKLIDLYMKSNNAYTQKINQAVSKIYLFRLREEKKTFQDQLIETCICESIEPFSRHINQDVAAKQNYLLLK